ncbi:class I SAM-dependent methyltransferase [Spirosoma sp. SC4-14]|uniref:class I SAM-dependent methyltransferase n=1 Tax=Spirosoma sp. SC4-14 TaxID=3128900 RepID=UPI0030D23E29
MKTPKDIVRDGYDRLAGVYRKHYQNDHKIRYESWLTEFSKRLLVNTSILELGCADGIPTAEYLSQRFNYLGIDLSPVQIEHARKNVPVAQFEVGDMTTLLFPDESFGGIVALYSIIHVPLAEQPDLFRAMYRWLQSPGYLLCVVGAGEWTGTDNNWLTPGTTMYWSHADATTYANWFAETGFTIIKTAFIPEGESGHTLFLLKK